jgi:hypothetical protein
MPMHIGTGHSVYGPTGDPTSRLDLWVGAVVKSEIRHAMPGGFDVDQCRDCDLLST